MGPIRKTLIVLGAVVALGGLLAVRHAELAMSGLDQRNRVGAVNEWSSLPENNWIMPLHRKGSMALVAGAVIIGAGVVAGPFVAGFRPRQPLPAPAPCPG